MPRSRVVLLASIAAGLLTFAPSASADFTMTKTADAVYAVGDDGPNRIRLVDGNPSSGTVFRFDVDPAEPVDEGDSGCTVTPGVGITIVECPTGSPTVAAFVLNGGDDTFEWYGDAVFDTLDGVAVDLGAGEDSNESGIKGVDTFVDGGSGADNLSGYDGPSSEVEGGPGDDRIVGGTGLSGETLRGGDGNDSIQGLTGNDAIFGDGGDDALVGGGDGDTITGGPGRDNVEGDGVPNAFSGNDTLILDDGEQDVAACGFGADSAKVDALDLLPIGDCESVTGGTTGGQPPKGGSLPGGSAKVALAKPGKLSRRSRRLSVKVTCPRSAAGSCSGRVSFTLRFTQRGKKRKVSAGSAGFVLSPGASKRVSRKLSKKLVKRLRKAKKRTLTVRASSRDNAGRSFTSTRTAKLRLVR